MSRFIVVLTMALMAVPVISVTAQDPDPRVEKTILRVSSESFIPIETTLVTKVGEKYRIEVSGIYTYAPGGRFADADFAYDPDANAWLEELPGVVNQSYNLDLLVNGAPQNWRGSSDGKHFAEHTFSQNHVYRITIKGNGLPLSFVVYASSYDWNDGALTVTISRVQQNDPE